MSMFLKDPAASLDYAVDWIAVAGDAAIAASDWRIEPAESGLTIAAEMLSDRRAAATLSGGTPGLVYRVINQVAFADGRGDARTLVVRVEAR